METKEHRRKSKRYPVRWKAAVVFDKTAGKPVLHTQTQDVSAGGAAIHTEYAELTGTVVTLLLAQPPRRGGEQPKMLKVRARVVSTIQTPARAGYRHGLSFLPSVDDGLASLEDILKASEPAASATPAAPAAPAAPVAPAAVPASSGGATMSRLEALRQLAKAKLTEEENKPDPKERVNEALLRVHRYLQELAEQLNVVKPACTSRGYAIIGVPEFSGLAWEYGNADLRARDVAPGQKICESVALYFRLSGNKQIKVTRESPASEKLASLLTDNKIEFTVNAKRNERGALVQSTFLFPCDVHASVLFVSNYDTLKIHLKMRNVERFGMAEYLVEPEAVTEAALEEFSGFILGESSRVGALLARSA